MNFQEVKIILIKVLVLNWLVAAAKILVGFLSGSLSILADGFHSFFDGFSNILGLVGIKTAERPEDLTHPYGHQKFEALAALGIAFLVLITGYEVLKKIVERFLHPVIPEITSLILLVLFGTLLINIFVFKYEYSQGKKLKSSILIADSLHTKSDIFITSSVILGMFAIKFGYPVFDPIIATFVLFMLGRLAWKIIKGTSGVLCDQALIDVKKIQKITENIEEIESSHQIRTRGDVQHVFLDMHISLAPELTLKEAHEVSHKLKEKIMQEIPQIKDVVIHIEPEER